MAPWIEVYDKWANIWIRRVCPKSIRYADDYKFIVCETLFLKSACMSAFIWKYTIQFVTVLFLPDDLSTLPVLVEDDLSTLPVLVEDDLSILPCFSGERPEYTPCFSGGRPEYTLCFSGVRVARSFVFCVMFCRSLLLICLLVIILYVLILLCCGFWLHL